MDIRNKDIAMRGECMFPFALTTSQHKRCWRQRHIDSGRVRLYVAGYLYLIIGFVRAELVALRGSLDLINIRANCRSADRSGHENNRESGQMVQRGVIVEHASSPVRGLIQQHQRAVV